MTINPWNRRSYGSVNYDKLQAWDVTVLKEDMPEAFNVIWDFWVHLNTGISCLGQLQPFLGFVEQLNFDRGTDMVLLEYSKSLVLKHACITTKATWTLLVAPGRAIVALHAQPADMAALTAFVDGIKQMNMEDKRLAIDGGLYINRVVLCKYIANLPDVKPHVHADGRTFYDRHKDRMLESGREFLGHKVPVLENHSEVLAQLTNFHYLDKKDYMLNSAMEGSIRDFLIKKLLKVGIAKQEDGEILHFHATTNINVYKVVCTNPSIAHWLCCTLKDQAVTQMDSIANISFKSSFHQPLAKDWEEHIQRLAICDCDPALPTSERDLGPIPSAFHRVASHAQPTTE